MMLKQKLDLQTNICKVCFLPIRARHLFLWLRHPLQCAKCYAQLEWHHQISSFEGFPIESFFDYGPVFKSRIHQFKGFGDVVLGSTFLHHHAMYIKLKYHGFSILSAPSHPLDIQQRGFHHLDEIILPLGLPKVQAFYKNKHHRQAEQNAEGRKDIQYVIERHPSLRFPRKILLFDDIMTTGETIRSMLKLLPIARKNNVKILVLARKKETTSRLQTAVEMLK
jgi:predicted amidophosphoribosyltransferase